MFDLAGRVLLGSAPAYPAPAVVLSSMVSPRSDDLEVGAHFGMPPFVSDDEAAHRCVRALNDRASLDADGCEASWTILRAGSDPAHMVHSVLAVVLSSRQARMTAYFDHAA